MKIDTSLYREKYEAIIRGHIEYVQDHWESWGDDIYTKPNEKSWSMIECLEHMNLTMNFYVGQFKSEFNRLNKGEDTRTTYAKRTWYGSSFEKNMLPKPDGRPGMKVGTFSSLTPAKKIECEAVIGDFFENYHAMLHLLNDYQKVDLNKVKVRTLIAPWPKFNAFDAIAFISAHNKRHLEQGKRALGL